MFSVNVMTVCVRKCVCDVTAPLCDVTTRLCDVTRLLCDVTTRLFFLVITVIHHCLPGSVSALYTALRSVSPLDQSQQSLQCVWFLFFVSSNVVHESWRSGWYLSSYRRRANIKSSLDFMRKKLMFSTVPPNSDTCRLPHDFLILEFCFCLFGVLATPESEQFVKVLFIRLEVNYSDKRRYIAINQSLTNCKGVECNTVMKRCRL